MVRHAAHANPVVVGNYDALHVGDWFPGHKTGRTYPPAGSIAGSNGVLVLDTLYAVPFYVGESQAFDRIVCATLGVASSFVRVGLYTHASGGPSSLIVDAGQIDTATAGEKFATISQTLEGLVWVAAVGQGVAPNMTRQGSWLSPFVGMPDGSMYSSGAGGSGYSQTGISGALPSSWGSTFTVVFAANLMPALGLRAS